MPDSLAVERTQVKGYHGITKQGKVSQGVNVGEYQEAKMKLKQNELRIYYRTETGDIDPDLDKALEDTLKKFGFRRWASGFEIATDIRDLAFESLRG